MSDPSQYLPSATRIISRDFDLDPDKTGFAELKGNDLLGRVKEVLTQEIDYLISHNMERLLWILYRVDVDEARLQQLIAKNPPSEAAGLIANLIIERQLEKAETRARYDRGEL